MTSVLVSGASVAGPVLAYWLARAGLRPTIVERAPALRPGGHGVDLFGPAVDVVAWMGLLDQVRAARTGTDLLTLVRPGRKELTVPVEALSAGVSDRHVEILRGELAGILYAATREDVEYVFGDAVTALQETDAHVDVAFASGVRRRFDLVVGADGLHSGIRRLVFGTVPAQFLGGHLAVCTLPDPLGLERRAVACNEVDRAVGLYPSGRGRATALFLFRSPRQLVPAPAPVAVVRAAFAGHPWPLVPRLLDALEEADDGYVDAITQIRMPTWSRGRVTLVGDAGYAPGPAVGGGTSLAVVGAYVLAAELAANSEPAVAYRAYERAMHAAVLASRGIGPAVLRTLIPRSRLQVTATAQALRLLARLPATLQRTLTAYGGGPAEMLDSVELPQPVPRRATRQEATWNPGR